VERGREAARKSEDERSAGFSRPKMGCFDVGGSPSKYYYCDCGRLPFHAPSHAFFLYAIEKIHDRNASLSIYLKKKFIYLYAWPVMPYTVRS
jgi:hypothetical protein